MEMRYETIYYKKDNLSMESFTINTIRTESESHIAKVLVFFILFYVVLDNKLSNG